MARRPPWVSEVVEDTRRVGRVAWASPPPQIDLHTFNEPHSPRSTGEAQTVRTMELQPSAYSRGANNYEGREMYRATQRAKGIEEED